MQVKDGVGDQGKAKDIADPGRVRTAHHSPGNDGIDIAVGEHHESGPQGGDDDLFQAVHHVGGVEQIGRQEAQGVAAHRLFDAPPCQFGAFEAGGADGVAFAFDPFSQEGDLGGTAHAVGPFQDDQPSRQRLGPGEPGQSFAVEPDLGHDALLSVRTSSR